jgi:hypothetical protein
LRYFVMILAAVAIGGSVASFGREYDVALLYRSDELSRYFTLAEIDEGREIRLPLSRPGTTELLLSCAITQTSLLYRFQPAEFRAAVDRACLNLATQIARIAPTAGGAYAVAALSSPDEASAALAVRRSAAAAPSSPWQGQIRIRVALPLVAQSRADLAADLAEVLRADIAFAAQSVQGRRFLAQLYVQTAEFRPLIVSGVEQAPATVQRSFVHEVARLGPNTN